MRLRTRMQDELTTRLLATLPEVIETAWDHSGVVVAIEKIEFTSTGGVEGNWERATRIKGILRAELHSDKIDDLVVEPLIANLLSNSIHLNWPQNVSVGETGESVRTTLIDWRDVIRDQNVASGLRFHIDGVIGTYQGPVSSKKSLISQTPKVGEDHIGDYMPLENLGDAK